MISSLYRAIAWSTLAGWATILVSFPLLMLFLGVGDPSELSTPYSSTWRTQPATETLRRDLVTLASIVGPLAFAFWLVARRSARRCVPVELCAMAAIPALFWLVLGPRTGPDNVLLFLLVVPTLSAAALVLPRVMKRLLHLRARP